MTLPSSSDSANKRIGHYVLNQVLYQYVRYCIKANALDDLCGTLEFISRAYDHTARPHASCLEGAAERILLACYTIADSEKNNSLTRPQIDPKENYAHKISYFFADHEGNASGFLNGLLVHAFYGPYTIEERIVWSKKIDGEITSSMIDKMTENQEIVDYIEQSLTETLKRYPITLQQKAIIQPHHTPAEQKERRKMQCRFYLNEITTLKETIPNELINIFLDHHLIEPSYKKHLVFHCRIESHITLKELLNRLRELTCWPEDILLVALSTILFVQKKQSPLTKNLLFFDDELLSYCQEHAHVLAKSSDVTHMNNIVKAEHLRQIADELKATLLIDKLEILNEWMQKRNLSTTLELPDLNEMDRIPLLKDIGDRYAVEKDKKLSLEMILSSCSDLILTLLIKTRSFTKKTWHLLLTDNALGLFNRVWQNKSADLLKAMIDAGIDTNVNIKRTTTQELIFPLEEAFLINDEHLIQVLLSVASKETKKHIFLKTTQYQDIYSLKKLIHSGAFKFFYAEALHRFIATNNLQWARLFIEEYDQAHSVFHGLSALHRAVLENNIQLVIILLEHGVDINLLTTQTILNYGKRLPARSSPIMIAALNNNKNIVSILINHPKFNPKQLDHDENTILQFAIEQKCDASIIETIINTQKITLKHRNKEMKTALILAIEYHYSSIAMKIIQETKKEFNQKESTTLPIFKLALDYDQEIVAHFLVDSIKNCNNLFGKQALCYAFQKNLPSLAKKLLIKKAPVTAIIHEQYQWSPLHYALYSDDLTLIRYIPLGNLNLHAPNSDGDSALHVAIQKYQIDNALFLIKNSKQSLVGTVENAQHITTFELALQFGQVAVIDAMLKKNLNLKDLECRGFLPLELTLMNNQPILAELILSYKPNLDLLTLKDEGNTFIHEALSYDYSSITKKIILQSSTKLINLVNKDGKTPLHLALLNRKIEQAQTLIRQGAMINYTEEMLLGYSPKEYHQIKKILMSRSEQPLILSQKMNTSIQNIHSKMSKK
jgi:ankyrin repeat protein